MDIDTHKTPTDRVPFYQIHRLENGTVIFCAHRDGMCSAKCLMDKCCIVKDERLTIFARLFNIV